jgi:hypothetical protein
MTLTTRNSPALNSIKAVAEYIVFHAAAYPMGKPLFSRRGHGYVCKQILTAWVNKQAQIMTIFYLFLQKVQASIAASAA